MANSASIFLLGVGKMDFLQPKKETEVGKEEVRRKIKKTDVRNIIEMYTEFS